MQSRRARTKGSRCVVPCRTRGRVLHGEMPIRCTMEIGTRFAWLAPMTLEIRAVTLLAIVVTACGGVAASEPSEDAGTDTSIHSTGPDGSVAQDAASAGDAGDAASDAAQGSDTGANDAGSPHDAAFDNDPRCPPSFGATGECTIDGVECRYPQGRCDCARPCSGVFIPDASWTCSQFTAPCPDDPPAKGSACPSDGTHCTYPGCCTTNDFTCVKGHWDAAPPFCPP